MAKQPDKEPSALLSADKLSTKEKTETRRRRSSSVSGVGPLNIIIRSNEPVSAESFTKLKLLGRGDVGKVYLVEEKATGNAFAMKILDKKEMIERNRVKRVLTEREILATARHPFVVTCYHSFMDSQNIYFVLDFCAGGEFFRMLQKQPNKALAEDAAKFYAAEVLSALEYLHFLGFIYRDLKPENILIDEYGHIKLTDFDLSKASASSVQSTIVKKYGKSVMVAKPEVVTNSFVGTDEYVAPEVIEGYGHTSSVDWWTLGILIYEMLFGKTPYKGKDTEDTWRNITRGNLQFPDSPVVSSDAKNIIKKLLANDAKKRLGSEHGALDIKEFKWFKSIQFDMLLNKKPPIVPALKSRQDTSYFRTIVDDPTPASVPPEKVEDDEDRKPLTAEDRQRAENALIVAFSQLGSPRVARTPYHMALSPRAPPPQAKPEGSLPPVATNISPPSIEVSSPRGKSEKENGASNTRKLSITSPRQGVSKEEKSTNAAPRNEKEKVAPRISGEKEKATVMPRTSSSGEKDKTVQSRTSSAADKDSKIVAPTAPAASRTSTTSEKSASVVPKLSQSTSQSRSITQKLRDALVSPRKEKEKDTKTEEKKEKEEPIVPQRKLSIGSAQTILPMSSSNTTASVSLGSSPEAVGKLAALEKEKKDKDSAASEKDEKKVKKNKKDKSNKKTT